MWPTASGATQETKYQNVKISLPSTKQKREKEQNDLRVLVLKMDTKYVS